MVCQILAIIKLPTYEEITDRERKKGTVNHMIYEAAEKKTVFHGDDRSLQIFGSI